jgi:hypothetical protein
MARALVSPDGAEVIGSSSKGFLESGTGASSEWVKPSTAGEEFDPSHPPEG